MATMRELADQFPGRLFVDETGEDWDISHLILEMDEQYADASIYWKSVADGMREVYWEDGDRLVGYLHERVSPGDQIDE